MRILICFGAAVLAGCVTMDEPETASDPSAVFTCASGERISVLFPDRGASVTTSGGKSYRLKQRPAGSGFSYEGEGVTLRGKGNEVTWTAPGAAATECGTEGPPAATSLSGTRWQLVQFQSSDDAIGTIRPSNPASYTMEFLPNGRFAAQVDCNRAMGGWSSDGSSSLQFTQPAMTRALCPPGSMDSRIATDLPNIRSYVWNGDTLSMSLYADGGIYTWRRLP